MIVEKESSNHARLLVYIMILSKGMSVINIICKILSLFDIVSLANHIIMGIWHDCRYDCVSCLIF